VRLARSVKPSAPTLAYYLNDYFQFLWKVHRHLVFAELLDRLL
jgi:hypothetical protein